MFLDAELQLAYKLANAPLNMFPYPHLCVQDVFPEAFYREIQKNIPDPAAMVSLEEARSVKGYKERFVLDFSEGMLERLPPEKREFWKQFNAFLVTKGDFSGLVFGKFKPFIDKRFQGRSDIEFYAEALLVQDLTNYSLGPHTDSPHKVVTMLFYLPADDSQKHLGTSIYVPKQAGFTCPGGPHYAHDKFMRMYTNPFLPNSMFAFLKTDNAFHGVEPVRDAECRRWLLLFDIYHREKKSLQP